MPECIFTEDDWGIWERIQERQKRKQQRIKKSKQRFLLKYTFNKHLLTLLERTNHRYRKSNVKKFAIFWEAIITQPITTSVKK